MNIMLCACFGNLFAPQKNFATDSRIFDVLTNLEINYATNAPIN